MNKEWFENISTLEAERTILREINEDDVEEIYEIFSNPNVAKYDWFHPIKNKEEALKFIERYKEEFEEQEEITWGIALKENNKLIGICCLGDFDVNARRAEIGYELIESHWNKGYATEAIKKIVEFGLKEMNLNRIEAFITPGNDSSVRVLEKVGFKVEGIVRERDLIKGKLEDGIIMGILKRDIE